MRVYVASKFENKKRVLEVYGKLREIGCEITVDWTKHKAIKPYKNSKLAEKYSEEEIKGIINADVFILLTTEEVGRGSHVELGTAIASNFLNGKPKIFVIGDCNTKSTFYFHKLVNRLDSIEDVIKELKKR